MDTDMKSKLESIRPEGETYQGQAWGYAHVRYG